MQQKKKRKNGRILPFERDVEFYLRRGSQRLERNDLTQAINNYYLALSRDPQNTETRLAIAEVLTEMHRYEQSNRILFPLLSMKDSPSECFFGIACNFLGLQDFAHAHDSLESYLSIDPDGEFVPDALEMLDMIEDEEALYDLPGIYDKEERAAYNACQLSRQCLENGRIPEAVQQLEAAAKEYPDTPFVHNMLALSYFCSKDFEKAMEIVRAVLEKEPDNIQAHCNLLLFLYAARNDEGVEQALGFLKRCDTDDVQDLNRMAVVFMETCHMHDALPVLKQLRSMYPYDESILHRLGACYYHLGQYRLAVSCYDRLIKSDPSDTIAAYYRRICTLAERGTPEKAEWLYHYQVPYAELMRRVREINRFSRKPRTELEAHWATDPDFRNLLLWSLRLPDENTKRTMLHLIASYRDYEAEQLLRGFLLEQLQPDAVKQDVFALLKQMGAREPYIAYLNGHLVQSKVQIHSLGRSSNKRLPSAYQYMLELCVEHMRHVKNTDAIRNAVTLFEKFINAQSELPVLRRPQAQAYAAALEYLAKRKLRLRTSKAQIAEVYGITTARLTNAVNRLNMVLENEGE